MILSNALIWLTTQSAAFSQYLSQTNTDTNRCWNISCNMIQNNVNGFIPIEISFDFGNPGKSTQDVLVRIFFNPQNNQTPYSIHQISNPWKVNT